jgi:hypothetical protein
MPDIDWCSARLRQSASLAEALDASFDAFEAIRQLARQCEGMSPDLFAAFMSAAANAADGRDAITSAPALPPAGTYSWPHGTPGRETDPDDAADSMAALAALLASRLEQAAPLATTPNDRLACRDAARSVRQIQQLMAPADDARIR